MATKHDHCIPVEDLEAVSRLPGEDPRRRHLDVCPRCSARWSELRDFLLFTPAPSEAQPDAARRRLQQWLDTELLAPSAERRPDSRRAWVSRERWAWATDLRFAAAAAAVVLVGVFWAWQRPPVPIPGAALRGEGTRLQGSMSRSLFTLSLAPGSRGDDVRLRWTAVANADAYEVTLLASDLSVLSRMEVRGRTGFAVPDSALGTRAGRAPTLARVRALRRGDEISLSGFVRLPPRATP